jgi:hypothetical protein
MNDFDPRAPKRMNMVNQQQINNTRIESYSNTLRHRESSVVNILLFIISGFVSGMASSFRCQRFRGQRRNYSKKKRNKAISAPTVFQRRFAKYTKMPEILCEKEQTARSVRSHKSKETLRKHTFFHSVFFLHTGLLDSFVMSLMVSLMSRL